MKASVRIEKLTIPTYAAGEEERLPMFFEKRVYQGSSGRVYPYPVTESIGDEKKDAEYTAVVLENDFIKVVVLPELGGRIYSAEDKIAGYDFVYRNRVIKPALVGLLGPWISGGIEFNWPQHHRPTTFMPATFTVKRLPHAACVWVGETEGMFSLRQVTCISLEDDSARIRISTDVYNPGQLPQTFLWWANPAYAVNDDTATIMPPDVNAVMDHGKRAVSTFPVATGEYYKMDYSAGVDISRYKNIPVPTSFMAYKSEFDFIGGYDYGKGEGLLHVADHRISPGKKQWTWGCGDFGKAWDDNLTDGDGPYVELMTGCFTDNQPDFTFIQPRESKSFTQYFMPYRAVGRVLNANEDVCFGLEGGALTVCAFKDLAATIEINCASGRREMRVKLKTLEPFTVEGVDENAEICMEYGGKKLAFSSKDVKKFDIPSPATACPPPEECENCRQLLYYGRHIEQYRHATRRAEDYYREGLRREPDNADLNTAYGLWLLRRGNYEESLTYSNAAIRALTEKNGNPRDTECYYNAGLALAYMGERARAEDMFAKCLWGDNAHRAMAELTCLALTGGQAEKALYYAEKCAQTDMTDMRAVNALARILRDGGEDSIADVFTSSVLHNDPINAEAAFAAGRNDILRRISGAEARDCAATLMREGRYPAAYEFLKKYRRLKGGADAMTYLYLAHAAKATGRAYKKYLCAAVEAPVSFARTLWDRQALLPLCGESFFVSYQLGCMEYDAGNVDKAEKYWLQSAEENGSFADVFRALSLLCHNKRGDKRAALEYMEKAFALDPSPRILSELAGLYKLTGGDVFALLSGNMNLTCRRDDLYAEYCARLVDRGEEERALQLLAARKFHPWEGGEGKVTGIYKRAHMQAAERLFKGGDLNGAPDRLKACLTFPRNLGEGKLALDFDNDVWYIAGTYLQASGKEEEAMECYRKAVRGRLRVEDMNYYNDNPVEYVYYAALAFGKLGNAQREREIRDDLLAYCAAHEHDRAETDYFAVSLPDMLVWDQDIAAKNAAFIKKVRKLADKLGEDICSR